ncbi:GRP family sugar transporter [Mumia sp. DW29H23]|uniref:GRP family sugar transporter n=1 Tax=Mumia sp. DW29H23 TaxID=3421241 RepID=UPI003D691F98
MDLVIGLVPAVAWGLLPILASLHGGRPVNQIVGTTAGTALVATVVLFARDPLISPRVFLFSFLSGACWAVGQLLQYAAYPRIGVSHALPVSTAFQLIGTSLYGVVVLGEWASVGDKVVGFSALVVIVLGVLLTSVRDPASREAPRPPRDIKVGVLMLLVGSLGYVGYSALPRVADAEGWAAFFPQAGGMLALAVVAALVLDRGRPLVQPASWQNLGVGVVFAVGALAYLISAQVNGIATGFTLTQMSVVLSTLGGIFVLKERRTPREMAATVVGLVLVVGGGIAIGRL